MIEWALPTTIAIVIIIVLARKKKKNRPGNSVTEKFPSSWSIILNNKVAFYRGLDEKQKLDFEADIIHFLNTVSIEGVQTSVDITDKLLVASSAVIPVFGFPEWQYHFLKYVILYPSAFDRNFKFDNKSEYITGMVGEGIMEGRVILSKPSLHLGFANSNDKKNVGIHEFIHLIDKQDGIIDGVPTFLNENEYVIPWLELIRRKTEKIINSETTDINLYGATNQQEFLCVTGEYFFENPQLLKQKHPELYALLAKAFNQDTSSIIKKETPYKSKLGRNSQCPCASGKKYKHCCMNN